MPQLLEIPIFCLSFLIALKGEYHSEFHSDLCVLLFYFRKQPKAIKENCICQSRIHPVKLIGTLYTTILAKCTSYEKMSLSQYCLNNSMMARGGQTVVDNCLIFISLSLRQTIFYPVLLWSFTWIKPTPGIFSNFFLFFFPFYISGKS